MSCFTKVANQVDWYLICLILFVLSINAPYFDNHFMVGHDTKNVYITFHYYYSHLVSYHELPRWLPFGEYGKNSLFFQICNLSPCSYLIGLLGWLVKAKNTLLLFKISVFAELLIFVLGLNLLTRRFYQNRCTAFIISALGVGSVIWYWQIYWDLRLYYLIPLILYFYVLFIDDQKAWAFWAAALTLILSLVGGLAYWAPIYLFIVIVMSLIVLPSSWKSYKCLLKLEWRNWLSLLLLVSCTIALGHILTTCLEGLHNYSPGRTENEMRTPLFTFLTYASPPYWRLLHAFIDGTHPYIDQVSELGISKSNPDDLTLYIGLLPLLGIIAALLRVRNKWFYGVFGCSIALFALAGSGLFSYVIYWIFPGISTFRHLVLLHELTKIFLLLSGGFGIELLLSKVSVLNRLKRYLTSYNLFVLISLLGITFDMVSSTHLHSPSIWLSPNKPGTLLPPGGGWVVLRAVIWSALIITIYILSKRSKGGQPINIKLIYILVSVGCLADIGSFQGYYWANHTQGPYAGQLPVEPLKFSEMRSMFPSTDVMNKIKILNSSQNGAFHAYYNNVLQYDPCLPYGQVTIFPQGIHELSTSRGSVLAADTINSALLPPEDQQLHTVMACNAPKLRLLPRAVFGSTDEELRNLIRTSSALDSTVILRGSSPDNFHSLAWVDQTPMQYQLKEFSANKLSVDVAVKPGRAGWLVYADSSAPGWRVQINGKETKLYEAYRAFKAVYLSEGISTVSFTYNNVRQNLAMSWLILVSICLSTVAIGYLIWQACVGSKNIHSEN